MTRFLKCAVVVAVIPIMCCVGEAVSTQQEAGKRSTDQPVVNLKAEFPGVRVQVDQKTGRVKRILGLTVGPVESNNATDQSLEILRNRYVGAALGLSSDLRELCNPTAAEDPRLEGMATVRVQQCVDTIPVLGAELVMSLRAGPSPHVQMLTTNLSAQPPSSTHPKVSRRQAAEKAERAFRGPKRDAVNNDVDGSESELVIFDPGLFGLPGTARLCWLVRNDGRVVLVDAADGKILQQYSEIATALAR